METKNQKQKQNRNESQKYFIDDFLQKSKPTLEEYIEQKIGLLYDLCLLGRTNKNGERKCNTDDREDTVRNILRNCKTETQIDALLHDVVRFEKDLNQMIREEIF